MYCSCRDITVGATRKVNLQAHSKSNRCSRSYLYVGRLFAPVSPLLVASTATRAQIPLLAPGEKSSVHPPVLQTLTIILQGVLHAASLPVCRVVEPYRICPASIYFALALPLPPLEPRPLPLTGGSKSSSESWDSSSSSSSSAVPLSSTSSSSSSSSTSVSSDSSPKTQCASIQQRVCSRL